MIPDAVETIAGSFGFGSLRMEIPRTEENGMKNKRRKDKRHRN
jgi:hypothetical protein